MNDAIKTKDEKEGSDPDILYRLLGWSKQRFYIWSGFARATLSFNAAQLLRIDGPMQIVPDIDYWASYYRPRDPRRPESLSWPHVGCSIIKGCYKAGLYSPPVDETVKRVGRPRKLGNLGGKQPVE